MQDLGTSTPLFTYESISLARKIQPLFAYDTTNNMPPPLAIPQIFNDRNASSGASSFTGGPEADDADAAPTVVDVFGVLCVPFVVVRVCGTRSDVVGLYPGAIRFIASFLKTQPNQPYPAPAGCSPDVPLRLLLPCSILEHGRIPFPQRPNLFMYRRLLCEDMRLQCEWVDELVVKVSMCGKRKSDTYVCRDVFWQWMDVHWEPDLSQRSTAGPDMMPMTLTGFGSHNDGDLMSGAIFAAWYCDVSTRRQCV